MELLWTAVSGICPDPALCCRMLKENAMTKKRDRKYRGIVIGLIFGLLMTGAMSFTVLADEAESPPNAVLAGESTEDALSGEDALTSPEALAEGLSEEMRDEFRDRSFGSGRNKDGDRHSG